MFSRLEARQALLCTSLCLLGMLNFIIKRLFDILGVVYKIIPITHTLRYYENWWERVYSLIKTDISCLVSQNSDRK